MNTVLYFAYGSNMSVARLENRVSSVQVITIARLDNHQLRFHKRSRDGSGKCNAKCVGDAADTVYGVLFEMTVSKKRLLDENEGLGNGYGQKDISVIASNGETLTAQYYYATEIDNSLKPSSGINNMFFRVHTNMDCHQIISRALNQLKQCPI